MSWSFLDSSGRLKEFLQAQGINPTHTVVVGSGTSATTGTYTTPAGCTAILVECVGGGGGGGGTGSTAAGQASAGGGGGGGAYASSLISNPSASYAYSIGGGGLAGTNTGGNGGTGGDTTFSSTLVVAKGGLGGTGQVGAIPPYSVDGGIGGAQASCVGDITLDGGGGGEGVTFATTLGVWGGDGGGAANGAPRAAGPRTAAGAGRAGLKYGGGGCGAGAAQSQAGQLGGVGGAGRLIITEFYGTRPTVFPPAFELAYVEYTGTVNATSSATASAVTVASAGALTFDGTTKIKVEFMAPSWTASDNSAGIVLYLFDGTTSTIVTQLFFASAVSGANGPNQPGFTVGREFTPTAGTHTYFVGINDSGAVTTTHSRILVNASAAGYLRISAAN